MSQKMKSMLLTVLFISIAFFGLPWTEHAFQTPAYCSSSFLTRKIVYYYQCIRRSFCEICTKFDAVLLSDALRNRIRSETGLQIRGRSSLCSFLQSPVTLSLFVRNILLSILFSNSLSTCSFLNARDQVSHLYRTTGKFICRPHYMKCQNIASLLVASPERHSDLKC
jgi:hypothetical protein